jgi:Cu(I)/Ag(I) efflux system membrane fusion protein/cobalt-zinc-cadmium efflux system membrane fusion protein
MSNKIGKSLFITFSLTFIFTVFSFAQEKVDSAMNHEKMNMQNMETMRDSAHKMQDDGNSIVRKGVIDLNAIDVNKDGKVFQDMMDYNVISDKPGKCPLCGMKLKEVSLKKAKDTLIKAGFKVK